MPKKANQARFEEGLRKLEALQRQNPGRTFTQEEIGNACGVTRGAIYMMETQAKVKLANLIRFNSAYRELLDYYLV